MQDNKKTAIVLLSVGCALLLASCCFLFYLWWDGQRAQQAAVDLLDEMIEEPTPQPEDVTVSYVLGIPSINLTLPVIWEYSTENLDTSVCRFFGPEPGIDGHLVITGHDYLSGAHFGRLDEVQVGDTITLMGRSETQFSYTVTEIVTIKPDDTAGLEAYEGDQALTLMTCADNANTRLLVRCKPDN